MIFLNNLEYQKLRYGRNLFYYSCYWNVIILSTSEESCQLEKLQEKELEKWLYLQQLKTKWEDQLNSS